MTKAKPEPVQVVKKRRDAALSELANHIPYIKHLGVTFDRRGDELTSVMHFDEKLIGNPFLPALHGGAIAAFLEITALMELMWFLKWSEMENDVKTSDENEDGLLNMPKTIDFTVDYLRSGLPRDAYARARVNRSGRRYASVHVEAWQDHKDKKFAQATGHFLMPQSDK